MVKRILIFIFIATIPIIFSYSKNIKTSKTSEKSNEVATPVQSDKKDIPSSLSIKYLRNLKIDSEAPVIEQILTDGSNYKRYIASYMSEGYKIYGLLTVPKEEAPEGGFKAIVFNHGYIPPSQYVTTEKYVSYVDYLARNGYVVFKIDMRGHGNSEGLATGSYFSNAYTIDAISALKSLQKLAYINKDKIGMWGHSMAGNLVLRAMLVEPDVKAGVIWAGAVYSYKDFAKYRLNDGTYVRRPSNPHYNSSSLDPILTAEVAKFREDASLIDFDSTFWKEISLTENTEYLSSPIQLHHSVDDTVVNVGYTRDLAEVLRLNEKNYEVFEYIGGGHNIDSPYFEQAMQRTVSFFDEM